MQPADRQNVRPHSLPESLLYHLLPGVLIASAYFLLVPAVLAAGYPSVMALALAGAAVLLPLEGGLLLWQGRRHRGRGSLLRTLLGAVEYRQRVNGWEGYLWVPAVFIASGLIMTVMTPVSAAAEGWFEWIPDSLRLGLGLSGEFARGALIQTYLLHFLVLVLLAPAVEELYFRGFLLPRMPEMLGRAGPPVHSVLFALYHLWSPWMIPARALALLPLIYIVRWKRNVYLGIAAHCLINSIDFFAAAFVIAAMG